MWEEERGGEKQRKVQIQKRGRWGRTHSSASYRVNAAQGPLPPIAVSGYQLQTLDEIPYQDFSNSWGMVLVTHREFPVSRRSHVTESTVLRATTSVFGRRNHCLHRDMTPFASEYVQVKVSSWVFSREKSENPLSATKYFRVGKNSKNKILCPRRGSIRNFYEPICAYGGISKEWVLTVLCSL